VAPPPGPHPITGGIHARAAEEASEPAGLAEDEIRRRAEGKDAKSASAFTKEEVGSPIPEGFEGAIDETTTVHEV
jgi:hypothetical protein